MALGCEFAEATRGIWLPNHRKSNRGRFPGSSCSLVLLLLLLGDWRSVNHRNRRGSLSSYWFASHCRRRFRLWPSDSVSFSFLLENFAILVAIRLSWRACRSHNVARLTWLSDLGDGNGTLVERHNENRHRFVESPTLPTSSHPCPSVFICGSLPSPHRRQPRGKQVDRGL